MSERRFNEAEVAAIFERAAEAQQTSPQQLPSGEGMTLTDIQEIGREVGFSSDQLARAAKAIELQGRPTSREFLGLPIGVGLSIDLARNLSNEEWERLVKRVPLKRPARTEEIASALEFLLQNEYMTGQTIVVDGGYSLI